MMKTLDTLEIAGAADKMMHAAQYLANVRNVWRSTDPTVIMLRERYQFLVDALDLIYFLERGIAWQR